MEIGRVAQIDNAKENYEIKTKQVSNVEEKVKTIQEDEYKKNSSKEPTSELNEVILDNIKFGYNRESKDFFVINLRDLILVKSKVFVDDSISLYVL